MCANYYASAINSFYGNTGGSITPSGQRLSCPAYVSPSRVTPASAFNHSDTSMIFLVQSPPRPVQQEMVVYPGGHIVVTRYGYGR